MPYLQLADPFRLVSSRGMHHLLRHPSPLVPDHIQCLRHRFGGPNHLRHFSTSPARPYGLWALYLNVMRSFRLRAHPHGYWDISHRVLRCRQLFRSPDRPWQLSMPPARLCGLRGLYLDLVRPFHQRARH